MAMFPTHIKFSTLAGIGGGIAAYAIYHVPFTTAAVGGGLCCIGGILPDIDSGPGIPLREITTFLASVVPTMLITRLLAYHFTQESLILTGAIIYLGIRFGLSHFLRHYTVHRGMFHSFPSMAIFGELTYLLFYGETMFVRIFMVCSVCLGFLIHLLLDEIYSVEWDGKPRIKKSFGTAMKFVGNGWWPNVTCYAKLAVLTYFVIHDPNVIHQLYEGQGSQVVASVGETVKERFDSVLPTTHPKSSSQANPLAMLPGGGANGPAAATIPQNSATVPPPSLSWPPVGAGTYPAPSGQQQYPAAGPQQAYAASYPGNAAAGATAYMPTNTVPPLNSGYAADQSANPRRTRGSNTVPSDASAPAPAPSPAPSSGRFWQ
jgi:hypothetical protein